MAASETTVDSLRLVVIGRYIDMAAGCLVIIDCLLTLDLEIKLIWKSKLNLMKVIYFINRYTTILDFVLICIRATITDTTRCSSLMKAEGVLYILGIYFAEYIFAMRTYVLWQQRKVVWIPLCLYYIGTLIFSFTSYFSMLTHTRYINLPPFNGCLAELPSNGLWINMTLLAVYDAAMVILIGLVTIDMWRSDAKVGSDLFRVLYAEGVLFYVYLLAFSLSSLLAVAFSSPYLFISMGRCARSVLASRVILHIRETVHHQKKYPVLTSPDSILP